VNLTSALCSHRAPTSESDEEIEILLGEETQFSKRRSQEADLARPGEAE
jgi:hypothetical protein